MSMVFKRHKAAGERRESVARLVKILLSSREPAILSTHLRELLTVLLWKLTEADSPKYRTRYQSTEALRDSGGKLHHEHVYQRAKMIDALLNAQPHEVDEILELAVGCTITRPEAERLRRFDDDYGWERYRKAGIEIMDTSQNPPVAISFPPSLVGALAHKC